MDGILHCEQKPTVHWDALHIDILFRQHYSLLSATLTMYFHEPQDGICDHYAVALSDKEDSEDEFMNYRDPLPKFTSSILELLHNLELKNLHEF